MNISFTQYLQLLPGFLSVIKCDVSFIVLFALLSSIAAGIPAKVISGLQEHDPSLTMKHGKQHLEHDLSLRITCFSFSC